MREKKGKPETLILSFVIGIGHFHVTFGLLFKESPGAHPSIWKLVFICMWMKTKFHMKGWRLDLLSLKKRPKAIHKLHLKRMQATLTYCRIAEIKSVNSKHSEENRQQQSSFIRVTISAKPNVVATRQESSFQLFPGFVTRHLIDLTHDGSHIGFTIIMQISYTLLRRDTTQVPQIITNIWM